MYSDKSKIFLSITSKRGFKAVRSAIFPELPELLRAEGTPEAGLPLSGGGRKTGQPHGDVVIAPAQLGRIDELVAQLIKGEMGFIAQDAA